MSYDPPPPHRGRPGQPPHAPRPRPFPASQEPLGGRPSPVQRPIQRPLAPWNTPAPPRNTPAPPRTPPPRPRPVEGSTELIPRGAIAAYDDVLPHPEPETVQVRRPVPAPVDGPVRKAVRTFGELMITAGLVILLFVVYEVYVTDLISAGKQDEATTARDDQWKDSNTVAPVDPQRQAQYDLIEGKAFAKM